ncbi:MAG: zf-TFIIB domain-containing protein [Desulfobacterales bacterium]|nr:zf-TFIIB domain-containing protein [Desulfobacterales bacterium]
MINKPSENEEEYFARIEFENKKKLEQEKHLKLAAEEKKRLQELHFMHCPKCGMELIEISHKGISVDKCPSCEGVWLDSGDLNMAWGSTVLSTSSSAFSGNSRWDGTKVQSPVLRFQGCPISAGVSRDTDNLL